MSGDGSLGYWSRETSHSSFRHCNDGGISEDESIEMSAGYGICGYMSLDTRKSSSCNRGIYHSSNDGRGKYSFHENRHSSSKNYGDYYFGDNGKKEVGPGLKRPTTLPLEVLEQELMLMGEVDIGTIPATLTPTI